MFLRQLTVKIDFDYYAFFNICKMIVIYGTPVLNNNETISYHGTFTKTLTVASYKDVPDQVEKIITYDISVTSSAYITHLVNVTVNVIPIKYQYLISITGNYAHISTK